MLFSMSVEDLEKIGFLPLACLMGFAFAFNLGTLQRNYYSFFGTLQQGRRTKDTLTRFYTR